MKYKLNIERDVDQDGYGDDMVYILNLPNGFRFYDDLVHTRGYDTMSELKLSVKNDIIPCDCKDCKIKVKQQDLSWSKDRVLGESFAAYWARTGK